MRRMANSACMSDTPLQTPSLIESDLATHQSTHPKPISLPRFVGTIACASPTATLLWNLPERRKKFRKARLDIQENVTIQIANTPESKHAANEILRGKYETQGYDTAFINDPKRLGNTRLLTLLAMQGTRVSGTCSILLDHPNGSLSADHLHFDHLNELRRRGRCLIEIGQLAIESEPTNSTGRITLAALFSYIALCANYFWDHKPFIVMEVAHRHVDYWKSLGFVVLVEKTWCERVNIPCALIGLDWISGWQLLKNEWQNSLKGSRDSNLFLIAIRRFARHFIPWEDVEGIMHRMNVLQDKNNL
jgi:hypothetical protein